MKVLNNKAVVIISKHRVIFDRPAKKIATLTLQVETPEGTAKALPIAIGKPLTIYHQPLLNRYFPLNRRPRIISLQGEIII